MTPKHHGSVKMLKNAVKAANIAGKWQSDGSKQTFRSSTGGILNWWPSSGTVNFQGKEPGKSQLERAFQNNLADTSDIGNAEQSEEYPAHTSAAINAQSCSEPAAMQAHGQDGTIAFKAELTPLLRDLADIFAKQKLVLLVTDGVPRITQEHTYEHAVASTLEATPLAHIGRY